MLPPMDTKAPAKISEFASTVNILVTELVEKNLSQEELMYLLITELIVPKLNAAATTQWESKVMSCVDEDEPLGHCLTVDDFRNEIQEYSRKMQHREFAKVFNKTEQKKDDKKADDKKKNSEKDPLTFTYHTQNENVGNRMPQSRDGKCVVPGCKDYMAPEKGGHKFVLRCPVLKTMSMKECKDFYKAQKSTCEMCFSMDHLAKSCPIVQLGYAQPCYKLNKNGDQCTFCETCS